MIVATYRDAAKKVLGRSKKISKPWIGNKTWEKIKERKKEKLKMVGTRLKRLKQRWREEYDAKNNAVKQSARENKRNCLQKRAAAAEKAAANGRNKEIYSIIRSITGEMRKKEVGVKEKQGGLGLKHEKNCRRKWRTLVKY